jgi:hypothetical protein
MTLTGPADINVASRPRPDIASGRGSTDDDDER